MANQQEKQQKKVELLSAKKFLLSWIKQMAEFEKKKFVAYLAEEKKSHIHTEDEILKQINLYKKKMKMFTDKTLHIMEKSV